MSVSYFVRYDISVPDLPAFLRRYREIHVPLVSRWPGLQRRVLHTPVEWRDPIPVNRERAQAREDFKQFMTFEGTVIHQAMASEEVWRRSK